MNRHQLITNEVVATDALLTDYKMKIVAIEKELKDNKNVLIVLSNSHKLFEKLLDISRKEIRQKICKTISAALQKILNVPHISVDIVFDIKRNQPEAQLLVNYGKNTGGGRIDDSFGGGVEDTISTVAKIIIGQLLHTDGPILADEPGKWIDSSGSSKRFGEFLKQLSKVFNKQFVITTHKTELREIADNIIEVSHDGNYSRIFQE